MAHHTVKIHVHTFKNDDGSGENNIAVVSPAIFDFMDKDTVEFTCEAEDVNVWFPKVWYDVVECVPPDGGSTDIVTREFKVPKKGASTKLVLQVDGKSIPPTEKMVPYQVYCGTINEFAVGDSPPKMVLKP